MRMDRISYALVLATLVSACESSESSEPAAEPTAPAPAEEAEKAAAPAEEAPEAPKPPPVPEGAKVFFAAPEAGEVKGPERDGKVVVPVKMGAEGIAVEAAGEQKEGSGHHHILIGHEPLAVGMPVPKDETHLHFGKGQTETELELAPGKHSLTLQFADGLHLSYGPELSSTIEVEVASNGEEAPPAE